MSANALLDIRVSATFTAEPLLDSLRFWTKKLEPGAEIQFAPFNQVFQSLLDPGSLLATNQRGLNVVVVRWQDLGTEQELARNSQQLIQTIKETASRFAVPTLVCTAPPSAGFLSSAPPNLELLTWLNHELESELKDVRGVHLISSEEILSLYPVAYYDDPTSDRLAHVPYTQAFFTALGTAMCRKMAAIRRPPYKVAVLDLDNTLWGGVVGEDGPAAVQIDAARIEMHRFLLNLRESGMLLAICSKNNKEDALEVFCQRQEMPLKLEHFAAARINWEPKSNNLRSLARELSLGLDSFIFIDDDFTECAEVQANCPEVLTLQLPSNTAQIPNFLRHVWAFDQASVTNEDRGRNESYRREAERSQFEKQTSSLQDFLAGLELQVTIGAMRPDQLARVAQLTQRTNQFNTTTIRRLEQKVLTSGLETLAVNVSDRFGDYGLVGAVMYHAERPILTVESFMLSCRALGRGVEHEIVRYLGRLAQESGCTRIHFAFSLTAKNAPAKRFLDSISTEIGIYGIAAQQALALVYKPVETDPLETGRDAAPIYRGSTGYGAIATELGTVEQILASMRPERSSPVALEGARTGEEPTTETQRKLVAIWAETLGVERVGIHDDFFEVGGYSLLAVELLRNIIETFGVDDLTLSAILEAPTVSKFERLLTKDQQVNFSCLVPIRATGSRQPFFCVHGAGGNVLSLRNIAMNLPDNQPFWCLQAKGLDGSSLTNDLKETATLYIDEIKTVQPQGPYFLGGGSYGGLFAYEMAQQLTAQGDEVALVAMFDTYNLAYGQMIPKTKLAYCTVRFFMQRSAAQLKLLIDTPLRKWPEKLRYTKRALITHAQRLISNLGSKPPNQSQPLPAGLSHADAQDQTGLTDVLVRVRDATMRAAEAYVPQPYSGRIALFTATTKLVEPFQDRYLGWGPLVKEKLEQYEIQGGHVTMGDQQEFADKLDAVLRRVQAEASPKPMIKSAHIPATQSVAGLA